MVVLLLLFCSLASAATDARVFGERYSDPTVKAADVKITGPVERFDTVPVYIHLKNNYTMHEWRASYWIRVDQFASLTLSYTNVPAFMFNPNLTISFEYGGRNTSTTKTVYSGPLQVFVTYFTVVIQLDTGGNVLDLVWDDGCRKCGSDTCVQNLCGVKKADMVSAMNDGVDGSLKMYVAWAGQDSTGRGLLSQSSVPSTFEKFSTSPLTQFGTGLWGDTIYRIQDTNPPPTQY